MHTGLKSDDAGSPTVGLPGSRRPGLPFADLNLCRNPFGEVGRADRGRLAVVEVDHCVQRLKRARYAVQFLGGQGRGKTTHLLAILRAVPGAAYVWVDERGRARIPQGRPLLIDEIQRLPHRRRRRLWRRMVPLALGTHEDLREELARDGYEVETVHAAAGLDAGRLARILNRRIEFFRRDPGPLPRIERETAQAMIDRFGDDLRAIQWHLYERFQNLSEGCRPPNAFPSSIGSN
jgi:hypothetical protein